MKNVLSEKNYIAIADWMLELKLNTRELLAYAIIYSFSQKPDSCYFGSFEYLANWLGMESSQNITRYLKPLVDKKLVLKKEVRTKKNQRACLYRTNISRGPVVNNPDVDYIIVQPWMLQVLHLNGKDLLLYALVHGYSRKSSGNVCQYKKDYFAKWLQCRKDNVERQVRQAIRNNLIREINPDEFVAIVPDNIPVSQKNNFEEDFDGIDIFDIDNEFPQSESTTVSELPQIESTLPQSESCFTQNESISSLKLRDNNLNTNNLENNLNSLNNNITAYSSKQDLSVVVNKEIPVSDFSMDSEKTTFAYKQNHDYELYTKYVKKNPYLSGIMETYALDSFRIMLARWPDTSLTDKAESLLIDSICSPKFKDRQKEILNLGKEKLKELFRIALSIYDQDDPLEIHKSKKAYLIGALEIMLQET